MDYESDPFREGKGFGKPRIEFSWTVPGPPTLEVGRVDWFRPHWREDGPPLIPGHPSIYGEIVMIRQDIDHRGMQTTYTLVEKLPPLGAATERP